jgi:3',5'-cyclic-AMP phosphodiesterase
VRLAHLSDLHVVGPGRKLLGRIDTDGMLARAVAHLQTRAPGVDGVLITGDLVDTGSVAEYEALAALLAPLTVPIYLLLGNHDDRAGFRAVFGASPWIPATGHVQYALDLGPLRLLALDTHEPGQTGGRLCGQRRAWLAEQLAAARDRPVLIAMHHPPFATGLPFMDGYGLDPDDARAFAALVAAHPNVERIVCGHLHRAISARFAGTVAATVPSTAHQVALDFDPSRPGAFTFEPPAITLHTWVDGRLVTHALPVGDFPGPFPFFAPMA